MNAGRSATQAAVIAPLAAAEQVVGRHRDGLDPSAARGVPAHVTVLFPFVPPPLIAPEPQEWFRAATGAMHDAFPDYPPYDGVFDDVVPHLTVADRADTAPAVSAAYPAPNW